VGFVVDKVALGKVFSGYFGFPYHSFYRMLHTHHHPPSGAGTVGQTVADMPSGLSVTPPQEIIIIIIKLVRTAPSNCSCARVTALCAHEHKVRVMLHQDYPAFTTLTEPATNGARLTPGGKE
jgi:hypothetical protein